MYNIQFGNCIIQDVSVQCPTIINDMEVEDSTMRGSTIRDVVWRGRKELRVAFMNQVPLCWRYQGRIITYGEVLRIANIWSFLGGGVVPKFVEVKGPSDVRVMFNRKFITVIRQIYVLKMFHGIN